MLACNNDPGITAVPGVEEEICKFISTGVEYVIGFTGTGSFSAEYRLYVDNKCYYVYHTSPGNRTAYIADRAFKVPAGLEISLRVIQLDTAAQTFKGTILGGK